MLNEVLTPPPKNHRERVSRLSNTELISERLNRWESFWDTKARMEHFNDDYYKLKSLAQKEARIAKIIEAELTRRGIGWKHGQIVIRNNILNEGDF